jgi:hypothetical protein
VNVLIFALVQPFFHENQVNVPFVVVFGVGVEDFVVKIAVIRVFLRHGKR